MGSSVENGIGTRVRAARERCGWNREALAFHSGVSWSAIAQVEAGRRTNVRPGTLRSLARALGVTIDYLVEGGRAPAPMFSHHALLYASDQEFLNMAAPFLAEAIEHGEPALAVTTESNLELLRERLGRAARGVHFAERTSWYPTLAVAVGSYLAFLQRKLEAGASWVRILGEPPRADGPRSDVRAWACYEAVLNLAFGAEPVSVMCPFDKRESDSEILDQARANHSHLAEPGGPVRSRDYADPVGVLLEPWPLPDSSARRRSSRRRSASS